MKKTVSIVFALALLCIAVGCSQAEKEEAVRPPTRLGEGTMSMSLARSYTFESAFEAADAVVRVEIGSWLGEDTELYSTFYEATVLETFKGKVPKTFTLLQEGCSSMTQNGYPLFTAGNELLLFLYEATDDYIYDSVYWIAGSFTTTIDVAYDTEGNRYYADRYGILCQDVSGFCWNYALSKPEKEEITKCITEIDPFIESMSFSYPYIYAEKDLESYMKGL